MFLAHVLGFVLLTTASVASSVSMNFQKLAQYQTEYTDPRSRQLKHPVPNRQEEKLERKLLRVRERVPQTHWGDICRKPKVLNRLM